ncbi:REI1 [Candida jiufengensis]|uniref:REI1 n=1 Tax=Candida jiufengensis TaxID=497108 RepID=UPI002224D459|nr:REI1 [Candida jiufengensis]KAI5955834.1 REI1 [Candida jiufengensis]
MFTCNTCNLQFPESEDQRVHMKSEWHRYNLKRKVAQLPPITEELFNNKVATLQSPNDSTKEKQITKKEQRRKEKEAILEKKKAILEQAKRAMMAERLANQQNGQSIESTTPIEQDELTQPKEVSETIEEPTTEETPTPELTQEQEEEKQLQQKLLNKLEIPPTTCLFSHPKYKHEFNTVDENIDHMFKQHGLYIPETNYLIDKTGLIEYLAEKIGFGFCLSCNYQGRNAEAAREHMQTKRHMRIPYETEDEKLEISKFYDFSSTYDDNDDVIVDGEVEEGEEDWEDVSDEDGEEFDSDEELPTSNKDDIYQNGNELILPSGAVVGHRSNARYYRQNLAPERILSEGQGTVIAAETRHMLTLQDRKHLAEKKRKWRSEKKREDINDRRAAKFINNQPHYRDQLLQ